MRFATAAGAAALVLGCTSATEPLADVRVTTAVAPTAVPRGAPVTVTVTVTNATDRVQTIPALGCVPAFVVHDAAGTQMPTPFGPCAAITRPPLELRPGETVVHPDTWRADVPAGAYRFRGHVATERGGEGPAAVLTVTP